MTAFIKSNLIQIYNSSFNHTTSEEVMLGGEWLLKLQNSDGGFPTFSRGWGRLPFDQSCSDLTGHAFLAISIILNKYQKELNITKKKRFNKSLLKAAEYLRKHQRNNGAWLPLWFGNRHTTKHENPVYGTHVLHVI